MFAVWPALLPNFISNHLYIWEYNIRDSTVLGLIGAGGLGLLVSEAVSLFQWGRLATLLIAIVLMVVAFDALSRRIRASIL
jgi:ABC-type phosphate/phosphonate transport system permease subunit